MREKAMRPRVYTAADAVAENPTREDSFISKLVKYIPTEVVTAYVAIADALKPSAEVVKDAIKNDKPVDYTILWVVFWVLLILAPIYTWFFTQEAGKPKPVFQTVVSPIAFTVWVFVLGGPFTELKDGLNQPALGFVIMVITLLLIVIAEKIFVKVPPPSN